MTMWKRLGACLLGGLLAACGSDGGPGQDGTPGQNGKNSLVRVVAEPPGANCQHGGTAVNSGLDANGNGALEDSEVTSTAYTCNGTSGSSGGNGAQVLVRLEPEPAGTNCAQGGTQVNSGVDTSGNGTLEAAEVTSTAYVCNGANGTQGSAGAPGTKSLVRLDPEPAGARCAQGGTAVHSGLDANGNNTLDTAEVTQTQYVCSGPSGHPTGWAVSAPAGATGYSPVGIWLPSGRKASLFKVNASSRLKITVSDNFGAGIGANGNSGHYAVRMSGNGVSYTCSVVQYNWNASGWTNEYHLPLATVCITDPLPVGLYEFETWFYAHGTASYVGTVSPPPALFVEEMPTTPTYNFSTQGGGFGNSTGTYQRASGRTVTYAKQSAGTLLKVTLADTFRGSYNQNGGWGTVMVRMNGNDTNCSTGKHDTQGTGSNFHTPFVMTCILPAVAVGSHTFSVWIRSGTGSEAYLGWERAPLLLIEEVSSQNLTYSNGSTVSGELSGDWSGVAARQIQHNVSAAGKTLRVTYSDTFRAAGGCNGRYGYYQLYVDNQPTGCTNGQYVYNSGANQDHHHPINQICLVKNLSPGPHTFSIWSSTRHAWDGTACGSNHFGWNRGQNLLMVEELP
ncbi:MAG TPA: hypothetical protein VK539_32595 [Myxococcaceae bacterium]|nr:hypothetical protein [Myxococcaceae bacterium]